LKEDKEIYILDTSALLTHSAAPSPAFEGGVKKRRSGSTLSKPQHLSWGVEGLTFNLLPKNP